MNTRSARYLVPLALPLVILLVWAWATRLDDAFYFPPLTEILARMGVVWLDERLVSDLLPSITRLLVSWLLASLIGIVAGVLLGSWHFLREVFGPIVNFLRAIPSAALVPFALLAFGIGDAGKIFVITFVCIWPVLINTMDAIDEIDPTQRQSVRAFRITRWRELIQVMLPTAAARIATGMRTSLSLAVIVMLITEMVASTNGIGFFTIQAQRTFQITDMWAGILMLGLLGFLLNAAFEAVERIVLAWYFESRTLT